MGLELLFVDFSEACEFDNGLSMVQVVLGGIMVIVLAIGSKFRWFKPGRERWIFKGDNNP
jgi:hypothetical protein